MSSNEIYAKAYKEVTEILKTLSQDDIDKIPSEIIETFESMKDSEYEFEFKLDEYGNEPELLEETEAIIYNLYKDYWTSSEEKDTLNEMENIEKELQNIEKRKKYNSTEIFKNNSKSNFSDNSNENEELMVQEVKQGIFTKIINFIKNIFIKK